MRQPMFILIESGLWSAAFDALPGFMPLTGSAVDLATSGRRPGTMPSGHLNFILARAPGCHIERPGGLQGISVDMPLILENTLRRRCPAIKGSSFVAVPRRIRTLVIRGDAQVDRVKACRSRSPRRCSLIHCRWLGCGGEVFSLWRLRLHGLLLSRARYIRGWNGSWWLARSGGSAQAAGDARKAGRRRPASAAPGFEEDHQPVEQDAQVRRSGLHLLAFLLASARRLLRDPVAAGAVGGQRDPRMAPLVAGLSRARRCPVRVR